MNKTNMSLAEQLTQLMSNAPPRPDEDNLIEIVKKYRGWDYWLVPGVSMAMSMAASFVSIQYFGVESFHLVWLYFLIAVLVSYYLFSKKVDRWWGWYYMPEAKLRFEEHASKVREVLTDWVAEPPRKELDVEFLSVLSQHWNHLNDSGYGDSLGVSFRDYQILCAGISVYRFRQG